MVSLVSNRGWTTECDILSLLRKKIYQPSAAHLVIPTPALRRKDRSETNRLLLLAVVLAPTSMIDSEKRRHE